MDFFKRLFAPQEVKAAMGVLEELETRFDNDAYRLVRADVEKVILRDPRGFANMIKDGTPVRRWINGAVSNIAGDYAESGEYHLHRGILLPSIGEDFLKLYDAIMDDSVRMGVLDQEWVAEQKAGLRRRISSVG